MASRLFRLHPDDFAYLKGLYGAGEYIKIDNQLFVSMEEEKPKFESVDLLNWNEEYGTVHIQDTKEGLEVWIGGRFRHRVSK